MNTKIQIINKDGKELTVTQKAFDVVYQGLGYRLASSGEEVNRINDEPVDLFTLSREELEKVSKTDIVKFLKAEEIDFDEKAKKEALIDLIAGE